MGVRGTEERPRDPAASQSRRTGDRDRRRTQRTGGIMDARPPTVMGARRRGRFTSRAIGTENTLEWTHHGWIERWRAAATTRRRGVGGDRQGGVRRRAAGELDGSCAGTPTPMRRRCSGALSLSSHTRATPRERRLRGRCSGAGRQPRRRVGARRDETLRRAPSARLRGGHGQASGGRRPATPRAARAERVGNHGCGFRSNPITDSGASRSLIPIQPDH